MWCLTENKTEVSENLNCKFRSNNISFGFEFSSFLDTNLQHSEIVVCMDYCLDISVKPPMYLTLVGLLTSGIVTLYSFAKNDSESAASLFDKHDKMNSDSADEMAEIDHDESKETALEVSIMQNYDAIPDEARSNKCNDMCKAILKRGKTLMLAETIVSVLIIMVWDCINVISYIQHNSDKSFLHNWNCVSFMLIVSSNHKFFWCNMLVIAFQQKSKRITKRQNPSVVSILWDMIKKSAQSFQRGCNIVKDPS